MLCDTQDVFQNDTLPAAQARPAQGARSNGGIQIFANLTLQLIKIMTTFGFDVLKQRHSP